MKPSFSRSWWPQQLLIGWLNLVLTAPVIYLYVGLPLVMRQHGWSGTEIGLLQLAGLPAMLKFVLATPVDRWRMGQSSYRNWAVLLSVGYAATLLLLGAHDIRDTPFMVLFALAMLVSLLGTWADIPINGLAIRILPESERIRAGAIRSAATSLGAIVGGGLMLMLHTKLGWVWPFTVLALGMLSGAILIPLLRAGHPVVDKPSSAQDVAMERAGLREWLSWFATPQHRTWAVLLVLYYPLIGAVWVYLKPLMLDIGFAPERIAMIVGVGGGLLAAIASMAGSWVSRRSGAANALPLFAIGNLLALALLAGAVMCKLDEVWLIASTMVVALMMGASAGLVFGLMMYHARPALSALDYGIQSSLFVIGRTMVPVLAGVVLDRLGYPGMLMCLVGGLALILVLVMFVRKRIFSASTGQQAQPLTSIQ
ncbi:MFS transporter [Pseudomonas aeruginosa]|uniref:MFS transporter n=1 Tax=Pseudomonas TaxID=286 RepID=UPI000F7D6B62|nr:MFS transporter [Pseudomonas aeruginosa]HEK0639935.1 MFS transporter [Proteus mirabilis]MCO2889572.1 MFS transporter [Pseudomonas aeruginosa]RTB44075.1 MFS transporter [Pseudomonas aeruginosa]RTB48990.1 MFS transporter [Pseudomonas aeruginosa]RTB87309.1 MFS transporter [Pseudomonas aeruginosa]